MLLAAALWLPPVAGGNAWPIAVLVLFGVAAVTAYRHRRLPPLPLVLVLYLAAYVPGALRADDLGGVDVARYFARPLIAPAVAMLVLTARQRRRQLLLIVIFALSEALVTGLQAVDHIREFGRGGSSGDAVTGTLGASQAGVVTMVALVAATLVAAAWLSRVLPSRTALLLGLGLLAVGIFSSTRAAVPFVLVVAVALAIGVLAFARGQFRSRRPLELVATSIVAAALLYGGILAIYPSAFVGAISSQRVSVLGGATAQTPPALDPATTPGSRTPPRPPTPQHPSAQRPRAAPEPSGVELLPGRLAQIDLAVHLSTNSGFNRGLLGYGAGTTTLDPKYRTAADVPDPQRTGSTWIGTVLVEAGWLGLCAFLGLLGWLTVLAARLWGRIDGGGPDQVIAAALPGIAALTALGAVFTTILDVRGYSIVFWILCGLALSAAMEAGVPLRLVAGQRASRPQQPAGPGCEVEPVL